MNIRNGALRRGGLTDRLQLETMKLLASKLPHLFQTNSSVNATSGERVLNAGRWCLSSTWQVCRKPIQNMLVRSGTLANYISCIKRHCRIKLTLTFIHLCSIFRFWRFSLDHSIQGRELEKLNYIGLLMAILCLDNICDENVNRWIPSRKTPGDFKVSGWETWINWKIQNRQSPGR